MTDTKIVVIKKQTLKQKQEKAIGKQLIKFKKQIKALELNNIIPQDSWL